MLRVFLVTVMFLSPQIVSADMDKICVIFQTNYVSSHIAQGIREQGCVRNNILQVTYMMDDPNQDHLLQQSDKWCRFDRNRDISDGVLSCVLYSTKSRKPLVPAAE